MVEQVLPEAYSRMKSQLLKHAKDGTVVDMQSVFLDFTSFVMGHMAYDMDLDSSHPFTKAFDYASDQIGRRFQNPFYFVSEFLFGSKLREALAEVRRFGTKIVNRAKQNRSKSAFASIFTNDEIHFDTLIDSLLETFRDPNIVADSALNFLSAGKDTTAQSFTWTLYCIMRSPEVLEHLREDIKLLKSKHDQDERISLTVADLQPANTPFVTATFYEALRLYPPIPIEIQECQQDLSLPDGTFLPKNSVVVWCIWAMNRAKEIHGADSDQFRPGRWLDEEGKFVNRSAFEFPVFNGGPRSCLGKKMAELIAVFLLVNYLPDFTFIDVHSEAVKRAQNSLTLPMESGLWCRLTPP
ncbi:hypothetical protein LTR64_004906 [Lithohypha guttulata]|uniref:uncharacterized protein n=1 Tax=Lithohypha guttulata TaxID=1690604 RepID=UPI00315CFD62